VPVAVNCCVKPFAMLGFAGVTAMETSEAPVTVNVVDPEMPLIDAVIVVEPAPTAVASPMVLPAALMVATLVVPDVQVTEDVMSCFELSEYTAVAVNCWCVPCTMLGAAGVTPMVVSVGGVTPPEPVTDTLDPPHPAMNPDTPSSSIATIDFSRGTDVNQKRRAITVFIRRSQSDYQL